jgi:hypothetical protein
MFRPDHMDWTARMNGLWAARFARQALMARLITAALLCFVSGHAQSADRSVAFAGFAYSGDAATIDQRFPFTGRYVVELEQRGKRIHSDLAARIAARPPAGFNVLYEQMDGLKGRDQAIVSALVVTSETVSTEDFGDVTKVLALVRAQALFFDFKTQTVVRAYPLSFASIKLFRGTDPTDSDRLELIRRVFEGQGGKPGILQRYADALASATVPDQVSRTIQVSDVQLGSTVLASLPGTFSGSPAVAETWLADIASEALSSRTGVPILPYAKGYAISNVMAIRFSDGEVFNLKLPKPDYEVRVNLKELRKVLYGQVAAGSSYIYGAFADISIVEPLMEKNYLALSLKNGEVKEVPATQTYVDDFPAFYDAINLMFVKLAASIAGEDREWIKRATTVKDADQQLSAAKELFEQCN